jgi:LacI family transcriptional regulator
MYRRGGPVPPLTILDVADKAGVSKSTVSRVLRNSGDVSAETRARVLAAVAELHFQPNMLAGGLRTRRTFSIALIIPDIANPFFPEVARGAQRVADNRGYTVLFANTDWLERRERDFITLARRNRVEGILINPAGISAKELAHVGCPIVILGTREAYREFDTVGSDMGKALQMAVEHLATLGHTRIALICGPRGNPAAVKRLLSFREAMAAHQLPVSDDAIAYCDFSQAGGYSATESLLQVRPRPTAIVCGNDLIAFGVLARLRDHSLRIPQDMAVVGIDGIDAAAVTHPPLTTVAKPKFRLGEEAATLLIDRIEGKETGPPQLRLLPTELIVRGSTVGPGSPPPVLPGHATDMAATPTLP